MFALIGAILAGVWLVLALIGTAVPAWIHPAVLLCLCVHLAWGVALPFTVRRGP